MKELIKGIIRAICIISIFAILLSTILTTMMHIFSYLEQKDICNRYSNEYNLQTELINTGFSNYGYVCYIITDTIKVRVNDFNFADYISPLKKDAITKKM